MAQVSSTAFKSLTASLYADNVTGDIGAGDLRSQMDNIADSAVFKITGRTTSPLLTDDGANTSGNGVFRVGDMWVNETLDRAFICLDNATNNAKWTEITFTDASTLTAVNGPAPNEIPVFASPTTISSTNGLLLWNGSVLTVAGNIAVTGTVDGRNLSVDGVKLDAIPLDAISSLGVTGAPVAAGTPTGGLAKTFTIRTGDGLAVSFSGNDAAIRIDNNRIAADTTNRTLSALDNGRFVTNRGASGTVRWTVPTSATLETNPRLVATFVKVANQTMELIGANTVTINGNTESGSEQSLITICPTPYTSMALLVYAGQPNTYYVYEININKTGSTALNQIGVWTGNGSIGGANDFTWDGSILNVDGELNHLVSFNPQIGATYTLVLTDRNRVVTMDNASPNTLTIPTDLDVAFPIGTILKVMQIGAGVTSIAGDTGVTLNGISAGTGAMSKQWGEVKLYKAAADTWYVTGDIGVVA